MSQKCFTSSREEGNQHDEENSTANDVACGLQITEHKLTEIERNDKQ